MLKGIGSTAEIRQAAARNQEGVVTLDDRVNRAFQNLNKSWVFYLFNVITLCAYSYFAKKEIRVILVDSTRVDFLLNDLSTDEKTQTTVQTLFAGTGWDTETLGNLRSFIDENNLDKKKLAEMSLSQIVSFCAIIQAKQEAEAANLNDILTPLIEATESDLEKLAKFLTSKSKQFDDRSLLDPAVKLCFLYQSKEVFREELKNLSCLPRKLHNFLDSIHGKTGAVVEKHLKKLVTESFTEAAKSPLTQKVFFNLSAETLAHVQELMEEGYQAPEKPLATETEDEKETRLANEDRKTLIRSGIHPAFFQDFERNKDRQVTFECIGQRPCNTHLSDPAIKKTIRILSSQLGTNSIKTSLLIQELLVQNFFNVFSHTALAAITFLTERGTDFKAVPHMEIKIKQFGDRLEFTYTHHLPTDVESRDFPKNQIPEFTISGHAVLIENGSHLLVKTSTLDDIEEQLKAVSEEQRRTISERQLKAVRFAV